ncbi:MAG: hypothetical protein U1E42_16380 [Rhodospirillales bacterium]
MHDLDRTLNAEAADQEALEPEAFEFEDSFEVAEELDSEALFNEADEIDLASELLAVSSDQELDYFLRKAFRRATRAVGRAVQGPIGRRLGGMLRSLARKALPIAAGAVGGFFGGPLGASAGAALGSAGTRMFEIDFEGLNDEDQNFEVARRYVRLTGAAIRNATLMPPNADPMDAARAALTTAASRHAPGLARALGAAVAQEPAMTSSAAATAPLPSRFVRTGRWYKRGNKIVLLGV